MIVIPDSLLVLPKRRTSWFTGSKGSMQIFITWKHDILIKTKLVINPS